MYMNPYVYIDIYILFSLRTLSVYIYAQTSDKCFLFPVTWIALPCWPS